MGTLRLKLCNANIHTYTSCFMEIQQKDNETLAAYVQCFKWAAKSCAFDYDTMAICIFVKGLWDAHTTAAKIYEKDPQMLSEVIRLVEKLNAAQPLTATLTTSTVSMMSNDDRYFVCGQTDHFCHHCLSVHCYSWDEFGNIAWDCPSKILPSGTPGQQGRSCSRHWYTHTQRTDHTPSTMVTDMGDISTDHNHTAVSHNDRSSSFRKHISCVSSSHCSS